MIQLLPRKVDAVEIINACRKDFENRLAAQYAENYGLQIFAGSDNHVAERQKRLSGIETEKELSSIDELIAAVRAGEFKLFDLR
jgi:predicted metal-dependent phosphoesterase TrpH